MRFTVRILPYVALSVGLSFQAFGWPAPVTDPREATIIDERHYSNVFGETRNYRIFLPPSYFQDPQKRYPVIYFFHGWSQRYFGSSNPYGDFDKGDDNGGDNIARFVSDNDVIVVKADGYNRSPGEPYYVRPYNVTPVETYRQFPIYFPELVGHVDTQYRTIPDREHRGISGLSMGGFMTFWISGKYPHLVSAAGNFCGSAEFEVGPKDFPVEYRHLDMYRNYEGVNVRLHYGDKDFIRGYHEDLNKVWPKVMDNYSFKVFDAAHSTCGMGEMLGFILQTFRSPPPKPARWHHTDVYPSFEVWDYQVTTDRTTPGFTILENVDTRGFRSGVRTFLPDGELLPFVRVTVKTAPVYEPNQLYVITDYNSRSSDFSRRELRSTGEGRLVIHVDGSIHEIGISKKTDKPNLTVVAARIADEPWATAGGENTISVRVLNKGVAAAKNVVANVTPVRESASVAQGQIAMGNLEPGGVSETRLTFHSKSDTSEIEKFRITLRDNRRNEWVDHFEIPMKGKLSGIDSVEIADGRTLTVSKSAVDVETLLLGSGNGDGIPNPGESIVILVRDHGKLWRTELTGNDPFINPFGVNTRLSDSWSPFDHVGASAKYDVPLIASDCPDGHNLTFAVEYWLPEYPLHIIRRGIVRTTVRGKDTTSPLLGDVLVTGDNVISVKLNDGSTIRKVTATLIDEKDPARKVTLTLDDTGAEGDRTPGDRWFSRTIPGQTFGIFRVVIEAEDSFGNNAVVEYHSRHVVH